MMLRLAILFACAGLSASASPSEFLAKPDAWFASQEGREITARILSWQSERGDWPKNHDTIRDAFIGDRSKLNGTFDNKATTDELRYLARSFRATGDEHCRRALLLGIDHILTAQYPNGGFPQYFPLSKQYHRRITFNDGCMIRLLELLREVAAAEEFKFIDSMRRAAAARAVERGIECIVKCQVIVRGKPTVWCAQHDEVTLAPAPARIYELASLSGSESAGILCFLMSLENPSPEVNRAVNAGAAWFESAKIEGIRIAQVDGDRKVIKDASAPPMWARFYEIETNRPIFCGRDGVKRYDFSEIEAERRNGYAWYGNWGASVAKAHDKWSRR
jgi:PelA/Pel-15E family pectate lyase